ncbi:MAG: ribosome silencing factor [Alphaproteobacteria bacterium]|nr:ribosome silencing factor [Alphaproteobacteria bacterium]
MLVKTKQEDEKILEIVQQTLEDNKADDVVVMDLRDKTSLASFMVVASGTSQRHVASLADKIQQNLKNQGYFSSTEGEEKADWVLIDAFDVIIHIFKPEVREFYSIEKMWQSVGVKRAKGDSN